MKCLLLLFFLTAATSSFSQLKDTLEAKKFWADNIKNIVDYKKEAVLNQIHFPLQVGDKKLTKEQFKPLMDKHFNPEMRAELSKRDFVKSIDAWQMLDDSTQTYMIVCLEGLDPQYEAVVLCFLQYGGKWKLNHIDYHRKEEY